MDTPFCVVNPKAANGRVGRDWAQFKSLLEEHLGAFEFALTTDPEAATRLAREALQTGHRVICSLGGDGTHSQVVNGFFQNDTLIRDDACLAIMPMGTGGDFRRSLSGVNQSLAGWARIARTGQERTIDLGVLDYRADGGEIERRYVLNIASFGMSGCVDRLVNTSTKMFGGRVSFLLGTLRAMATYRPRPMRVSVDGILRFEGPALTVAVCNGQYFGGGMWVAPNADLSDGLFDVVVIPWRGALRHAFEAGKIYKGTHLQIPGVEVYQGRHVTAECDGEALLDIDGESPGGLPTELRLLPAAIRIKEGEGVVNV